MIKINQLTYRYPQGPEVLTGINTTIAAQKIVGILGPNGIGKSTLLHLMAGILKPTSGAVTLQNQAIYTIPYAKRAQEMAYVQQEESLQLNFSVWDIVMMGRQAHQGLFSFDSPEDTEIVTQALHITDTYALKERSILDLSGGERRRVLMARALSQSTNILLLDEPTSHLDIHYQLEIFSMIHRLKTEQKKTIVVTLHDINLASQYCDELILLAHGQIFAQGTPQTVITADNMKAVFKTEGQVTLDPETQKPYYRIQVPLL